MLCFYVRYYPWSIKQLLHLSQDNRVYQHPHGALKAKPNQFPFQVQILAFASANSYSDCGGSLIRGDLVLTAAHCLQEKQCTYNKCSLRMLKPVMIVLGSTRSNKPSDFQFSLLSESSVENKNAKHTMAKEIILHPKWNYNSDIAYGVYLVPSET